MILKQPTANHTTHQHRDEEATCCDLAKLRDFNEFASEQPRQPTQQVPETSLSSHVFTIWCSSWYGHTCLGDHVTTQCNRSGHLKAQPTIHTVLCSVLHQMRATMLWHFGALPNSCSVRSTYIASQMVDITHQRVQFAAWQTIHPSSFFVE